MQNLFTLIGLCFEIAGVFLFSRGALRSGGAIFKYWSRADGGTAFRREMERQSWYTWVPARLGEIFGSEDVRQMEVTQSRYDAFADQAWGLGFVALGFILQALGILITWLLKLVCNVQTP